MLYFLSLLTIALSVTGFALSRQNLKMKKELSKVEDLRHAEFMEGFRIGYRDASEDAVNVRQAHERLFGKP